MKINEAIKILKDYIGAGPEVEPVEFDKAIKLGLEALKEVKESRIDPSTYISHPLRGETKK